MDMSKEEIKDALARCNMDDTVTSLTAELEKKDGYIEDLEGTIDSLRAENAALLGFIPDVRRVVGFVLGWWPGYEDAIKWGDEIDEEDHPFYMAAKRIRAALDAKEE